jgi:hypothetical protein
MTNERGELHICDLVATKAHSQFEQHLVQCRQSLDTYGHPQPQIIYTDNMSDQAMLQTSFPSLTKDVLPVEKYAHLPQLQLPSTVQIVVRDTGPGIDQVIHTILDDIGSEESATVGFDTEWNVHISRAGQRREVTALVQIAWKNFVYLLRVSYSITIVLAEIHMLI